MKKEYINRLVLELKCKDSMPEVFSYEYVF